MFVACLRLRCNTSQRGLLAVVAVERRDQLGDHQQIAQTGGDVEQREDAALAGHGRVGLDEGAETTATQVRHPRQVHHKLPAPLLEQAAHLALRPSALAPCVSRPSNARTATSPTIRSDTVMTASSSREPGTSRRHRTRPNVPLRRNVVDTITVQPQPPCATSHTRQLGLGPCVEPTRTFIAPLG